jgi:hypothetical protein
MSSSLFVYLNWEYIMAAIGREITLIPGGATVVFSDECEKDLPYQFFYTHLTKVERSLSLLNDSEVVLTKCELEGMKSRVDMLVMNHFYNSLMTYSMFQERNDLYKDPYLGAMKLLQILEYHHAVQDKKGPCMSNEIQSTVTAMIDQGGAEFVEALNKKIQKEVPEHCKDIEDNDYSAPPRDLVRAVVCQIHVGDSDTLPARVAKLYVKLQVVLAFPFRNIDVNADIASVRSAISLIKQDGALNLRVKQDAKEGADRTFACNWLLNRQRNDNAQQKRRFDLASTLIDSYFWNTASKRPSINRNYDMQYEESRYRQRYSSLYSGLNEDK